MKYLPTEKVDQIRRRLESLYGDRTERLLERLALCLDGARNGVVADEPRSGTWDQTDALLITYGDSIVREGEAPLQTLDRFAREHLDGVVRTIHILPFSPFSSDDGFSVIDYRAVNEQIGDWADIERLGEAFELMFDLVLNHVSSKSSWFRDFRRGIAPGRHFFVAVEPDADTSMVVRPRSLPLLTPAYTPAGERYVWTTFSPDQVDLDFSNPDVLFEFIDIMLFYFSKGARILRLDAIAYLWKELGTPCIHLPQTHEVVKLLRDVTELAGADAKILTETNVPHEENISYFGNGDEAHIVYQFSLPPLLLHALHTGNGAYLTDWADGLEDPPSGCTFLNFTASHDGIGVRPLQGLISEAELDELLKGMQQRGGHVSTREVAEGVHSPYEINITYFDALGDRSADQASLHVERFLCSQIVALSLKGIPAVYLHSLTATRNDYGGVKETGRARTINRMQWNDADLNQRLADKASVEHRVFREYTRLLRLRRGHPAFHPDAAQRVVRVNHRVFAVVRQDTVLCVANLTAKRVRVDVAGELPGATAWHDLIADKVRKPGALTLAPYQVVWLTGS